MGRCNSQQKRSLRSISALQQNNKTASSSATQTKTTLLMEMFLERYGWSCLRACMYGNESR